MKADKLYKIIQQNNMYPSKEQLESKWWHRLIKVLRWILSIAVLVYCALLSLDDYDGCNYYLKGENCNENLLIGLSITIALAVITYFVFWLVYKKIILYIVFGKKNK